MGYEQFMKMSQEYKKWVTETGIGNPSLYKVFYEGWERCLKSNYDEEDNATSTSEDSASKDSQ